ncbi:MAG: patatin-like phospholipase family protein [Lachnospiraceae bacterium]
MSRSGLVLEGGAMRGMFTAGVVDVFLENDVTFDGAVGVSAGAVFGCNIKSKQIGRAIRYNKRFCKNWHYGSLKSLLRTGDLYDADFCYEQLPYELDPFDLKTYQANPMHFYVVATDAETGKPVYKDLREGGGIDMDWFRASATMPIVSRPVEILDGKYLDGGISDSIPLTFMEKSGYDVNVVVLTQPEGYRKEPAKHEEALRLALRQYPAVAERLICRHTFYNSQLDHVFRERDEGKTFVITPPEALGIGSVTRDPDELERVYQIGRKTMQEQLPALKEFLIEHETVETVK